MAVVLPTVSIQKALSLLPVSDKIGVSAGHTVPGKRGHFLDMANEDVPLDGVTFSRLY